jgi:hypothetical protein
LILALTIIFALIGTLVAPVLLYLGFIGLLIIWGLSVYWALDLRRLLSAHLYRNQALGEGFVAIGWASFNASNFIIFGVQGKGQLSSTESFLSAAVSVLAFVLTFYWIDSSVLAARKSDPLFRDTFHWRKVRLAIWPVLIVSALLLLVLGVAATSLLIQGSFQTGRPTILFGALLFTEIICTFGVGLPLLLVAGRRSKDQTLRGNLGWFALLAASVLVLFGLGSATGNGSPGTLSSFFNSGNSPSLTFILVSYCVYRSVKSLAPINRLPGSSAKLAGQGNK